MLRTLDFDFFELLDSVTISLRPCLTEFSGAINYNEIYSQLMALNLAIYTPSNYIMPSRMAKYIDLTHHKGTSLTQQGREEGIRFLMSINEPDLVVEGLVKKPDFEIVDADTGITWYWEHCGMMTDPKYKKRWLDKKALYKKTVLRKTKI